MWGWPPTTRFRRMSPVRPTLWLWRAAALVVVLHVLGIAAERLLDVPRATGVLRQFDLNAEGNATAWFGSFLLLAAAVVAGAVAVTARSDGSGHARRWTVLAVLMLVMSVDETAQLHDLATGPLRRALDTELGLFHFAWVLPALLVLLLAGLYLAPLVRTLELRERTRLLRAAAVYVTGAVVLEMAGGLVVDVDVDVNGYTLPYLSIVTLEETLEMVGAVMLVGALLQVAGRRGTRLVVGLGSDVVTARPASDVGPTVPRVVP